MFSLKRTESQRSCSQRSGMQWLPADHPRCRERAGWPATGAAGKPFGDFPSLFPAPHGAGTLGLQAGLGSAAVEGAGRGGATSTGKAAPHPGLLARQGWPWITRQQELIWAWESCQQPQELCSLPGHLGQQLSAPYRCWEDTAG